MQCTKVAVLMLLVFVTAIGQIFVRHEHRLQYLALNQSISERDDLNIEWNQLLTESSTWSFPHRVEKDATQKLSMRPPMLRDIKSIDELKIKVPEIEDSLSFNQVEVDGESEGGLQ